jgi:hypothetical protein
MRTDTDSVRKARSSTVWWTFGAIVLGTVALVAALWGWPFARTYWNANRLESVGARLVLNDAVGRPYSRFFHKEICSVTIERASISPGVFRSLRSSPQLETLCLTKTTLNDDQLKALSRLTRLTWLRVSHCEVTDAGAMHLSRLPRLRTLNLTGNRVTSRIVPALNSCSELQHLYLSETDVDDAGIASLDLPELEFLSLQGTRVTDACLHPLTRLPCLERLDLSRTLVTDEGLRIVAQSNSLAILTLNDTMVSREAVLDVCLDRPSLIIEMRQDEPSVIP